MPGRGYGIATGQGWLIGQNVVIPGFTVEVRFGVTPVLGVWRMSDVLRGVQQGRFSLGVGQPVPLGFANLPVYLLAVSLPPDLERDVGGGPGRLGLWGGGGRTWGRGYRRRFFIFEKPNPR